MKEVNSMTMAPVSIRLACLRIIGIATLPTADAPVRNFAASIHPPPSRLIKNCVDPPPKNMHGIGTSTYMRADNIGHQLLYSTQACQSSNICSKMLAENIKASPPSTSKVIAMIVEVRATDRRRATDDQGINSTNSIATVLDQRKEVRCL
uniref:Uncharacterized protein n=1 Tax=Opuntia streptacantha TaxID=393608 RepID=A0A7C9DSE3_OPUST